MFQKYSSIILGMFNKSHKRLAKKVLWAFETFCRRYSCETQGSCQSKVGIMDMVWFPLWLFELKHHTMAKKPTKPYPNLQKNPNLYILVVNHQGRYFYFLLYNTDTGYPICLWSLFFAVVFRSNCHSGCQTHIPYPHSRKKAISTGLRQMDILYRR